MALAYVQSARNQNNGSATTVTCAFTGDVAAGSLLVVASCCRSDVTGVTGGGFTWHKAVDVADTFGPGTFGDIWYVYPEDVTAGPVTVTVTSGSADPKSCCIAEYSGVQATGDPLDKTATGTDFNQTALTASTATTTQDDELLVGMVGNEGSGRTISPAGGWNEREDGGTQTSSQLADQIVSATGAYTYGGGISGGTDSLWVALIATFKAEQIPASAALTGTALASITEADIVAGGKTIIATLTEDTWVPASFGEIEYVGGKTGGRAGSTSTTTIDLTTGITGGIDTQPREGDLVIITVVVGSQARTPACAVSGYTAYGQQDVNGTTYDTSMNVSYKFMTSTPDTDFTLPSTGNIADAQRYTVQIFRGVDSTTHNDVASQTASGTGTARPNPASITPSTAGAWVVICGGGAAQTGAAYTAPANFTTNFESGSTADTNDAMVGSGYWDGWTSGAVDPAAYTGGSTNAANSWAARTIALRPLITTPFADARAALRDGLDSAQSEAGGWDAKVKPNIPLANIVRTSDTVCTVTLQAQGDYDITAQEVVTWTIPASAVARAAAIVATPTFTIDPSGGGGGGSTVPAKMRAYRNRRVH